MTLFPAMVETVLSESISGRGIQNGCFSVGYHNIRDFSQNKHKSVDDTTYGGGFGMLMAAPPIYRCYEHILEAHPSDAAKRRVIYLSPRGKVLTQRKVKQLSEYEHIVLLCGHYEGVDQRILDEICDEEVSIGDYILTGGELPACILVDAVARLLPGVLPDPLCHEEESIASGLLEYPQYTKPPVFLGREVPPVLLSGHHENIRAFRLAQSLALTKERRPDLYRRYLQKEERKRLRAQREKEAKRLARKKEAESH